MINAAPRHSSAHPTVRPSTSSSMKWLSFVPYVLLLVGAFRTFGHSVDDSYITFRYAANLLHGHGPVFNIGERVEGYSSPLHMLLSTVLLLASPVVDILFASKLSSLLFGLLTLWQTKRLGRLCGLPSGFVLFAQVLVALNINFAIASVNALETSLYAFLLIMSVNTFLTEMQGQSGQKAGGKAGIASGLWLFLTLLARPDTLLVFVGLLLVRFMRAKKAGRGQAGTLSWAAAFVVPTILFIACRYAYYGYPLPNTYYAKSVSLGYGLKFGIPYLQYPLVPFSRLNEHWSMMADVLKGHGSTVGMLTVLTMPLFWGLALMGVKRACRGGRIAGLTCAAVIGANLVFVLRYGGDWMSGWRFMAATIPFFAVFQCYGLLTILKFYRKNEKRYLRRRLKEVGSHAVTASSVSYRRALPTAVLVVCMVGMLLVPHSSWAEGDFATQPTQEGDGVSHVAMRLFSMALPFLTVASFGALLVWLWKTASGSHYRRVIPGAVLAVWAVAAVFSPHVSWAESGFATRGEALMNADEEQNGAFEVMVGNYIHDNLKSCESVAYSEMGYASFVNQDKRFVDVHGLTDAKLAHMPAKYKQSIGFVDRHLRVPDAPLSRYLMKRRPDAIVIVSRTNRPEPNEPILGTWQPVTVVGPAPAKHRAPHESATVAHIFVENQFVSSMVSKR